MRWSDKPRFEGSRDERSVERTFLGLSRRNLRERKGKDDLRTVENLGRVYLGEVPLKELQDLIQSRVSLQVRNER